MEKLKKIRNDFTGYTATCAADTLKATWDIVKEMEQTVRGEITTRVLIMTEESVSISMKVIYSQNNAHFFNSTKN